MTFEELKLTRQFIRATEDAGYERPSPIQEKAIPPIRAGQDVIGIAQTGTGKTAAFLLPTLQKLKFPQGLDPRAVVLAPTKELVLQIHQEAVQFARHTELRCLALYGGIGYKEQLAAVQAGQDLLIATPGRFLEIYQRGGFNPKKITTVVLDEADRMMDMGFMPQLRLVQELVPSKRQNLLFSATFPERVQRLADEFLLWPTRVEATPQSTPVATVKQYQAALPNVNTKLHYIKHLLTERFPEARVMVFVREKDQAEQIGRALEGPLAGSVRTIHSNKGQNSRIHAMDLFREGAIRCLVSTDVASRGIDVPETSVVINFSVPRDPHDYVHRIGRTGRAFREGVAITLVDPSEGYALERIVELTSTPIEPLELPEDLPIEETPRWEKQAQARTIDGEMRKRDPNYKGAFHEKKKKSAKGNRPAKKGNRPPKPKRG